MKVRKGGRCARVGDARCCRQQLFLLRCCSNCLCRAMSCVVCTWQVERAIGRGEGTRAWACDVVSVSSASLICPIWLSHLSHFKCFVLAHSSASTYLIDTCNRMYSAV